MDGEKTFTEKVEELYKKASYLDKYGGSVFMAMILLIVFFLLFSYFQVMNNLKPIKADWMNQRCSPGVIPFAGLINKDPNMSAFEFTGNNFKGCVNNILIGITGEFLKPFNYLTSILHGSLSGVLKSFNSIRSRLSGVSDSFKVYTIQVMGRLMNFLMPLRLMFIKFNDSMRKTQGVIVSSIYSALGGLFIARNILRTFVDLLVKVLIAIVAIIVLLFAFFFTAPLASIPLAIFTILLAFLIPVVVGLQNVVNMEGVNYPDKPSRPRCFDEYTYIEMEDGTIKFIRDIKIGEKLKDGSIVTGKLQLTADGVQMYRYKNIIVSGSHRVKVANMWKKIEDLENKYITKIKYDKPYIYCLTTDTKQIKIEDDIFMDWDEVDENVMNILQREKQIQTRKEIDTNLNGGFDGSTKLTFEDGSTMKISDTTILGKKLKSGETILGIIEIDGTNKECETYLVENIVIQCSKKILVINDTIPKEIQEISSETMENTIQNKKLYHIITNKGTFSISTIKMYDYNFFIDRYA